MKPPLSFQSNVFCAGFIHQAHSKQLQKGHPGISGTHHCTYWEIQTTINGQQTDPGLNLQLNRLGFILTYSTNKSMVEGRYALKAYKVSITHCLKWSSMVRMCYMWKTRNVCVCETGSVSMSTVSVYRFVRQLSFFGKMRVVIPSKVGLEI